jgi:hypothetical protein
MSISTFMCPETRNEYDFEHLHHNSLVKGSPFIQSGLVPELACCYELELGFKQILVE